jgi:agmatinase
MARVREICPFVSIGVRSLSSEENEKIQKEKLCVYDIHRMRADSEWMENSLADLGGDVYITFDLDVLDPSVMPAVGTPEPGGLGWMDALTFLKKTFKAKRVVGMDMVELSPNAGLEYGVFHAAKLLYRMIGYWAKSI